MSERRALLRRLAPVVLLLLLAAAIVFPVDPGLRLANADPAVPLQLTAALDGLPEDAVVLVGFDPDLGTYAEIRPTARAILADLLGRGSTLAFLSLTPEGRALALAELDRLDALEANPRQIVDLGFVPGAEAALVGLARAIGPEGAQGVITGLPGDADLSSPAMALVIGGNDIGPRSWVEQVAPRVDELDIIGLAPTVLLPELQPYLASGQLAALIATPRDGAAYRASVELGPLERLVEPREPATTAIAIGLLAALAVLGQSIGERLSGAMRAARSREAA